jgi:hypothetical protein
MALRNPAAIKQIKPARMGAQYLAAPMRVRTRQTVLLLVRRGHA